MSPLALYRQMIANGMDEATAFAMAEQFEAERSAEAERRYAELLSRLAQPIDTAAEKRREWDRARKAAKKSGGNPVESTRPPVETAEIHPTKAAPAPVHTRGENNLSRLVDTGLVGGVGVERERDHQTNDWPVANAKQAAELIVHTVASPWLDPNKSTDLVTTAGRFAAWKREGASWEHDVLPVITGLCANRRARISSWKFFDAAIGRSIADNRQALEIPEAASIRRATGPPISLTDRIAAETAESHRLAFAQMDAANG